MALCTTVTDVGTTTPRTIRWGWWHVERLAATIRADLNQPDLALLDALSLVPHTVRTEVTYTDPPTERCSPSTSAT